MCRYETSGDGEGSRTTGGERRKGRSTFPNVRFDSLSMLAPPCPSLRYAQSGFSKLTFAPTVTSILRFLRTTLGYQRTLGMRVSHRRKKSWSRALLFSPPPPLPFSLSLPPLSVGRLLISGRCQLPEMNHRSCVRACVRVDFRLAQVHERHTESSRCSRAEFSCWRSFEGVARSADPAARPSDKLAIHHHRRVKRDRERDSRGRSAVFRSARIVTLPLLRVALNIASSMIIPKGFHSRVV